MTYLDEIKQRLEKATPKERWECKIDSGSDSDGSYMAQAVGPKHRQDPANTYFQSAGADAVFIAHARTDIQRLVQLVERYENVLRRLVFNHCKDICNCWACEALAVGEKIKGEK